MSLERKSDRILAGEYTFHPLVGEVIQSPRESNPHMESCLINDGCSLA